MNEHQKAAVSGALPAYRRILERAYNGTSKSAGVKAFCLQCTGYVKDQVRHCSAHACALHPYRPYQTGGED